MTRKETRSSMVQPLMDSAVSSSLKIVIGVDGWSGCVVDTDALDAADAELTALFLGSAK